MLNCLVRISLSLIRSIVSGLWGGVCPVSVCSEAGADQSSVSVCLGAAGGGLS